MIKLTAISYNNQVSLVPLSATFGRDGGTVGRSEDNYFVLPDPKNLVSRIQALIKSDGTRHTISNLSQANPILLNGKELGFDREQSFNAGDEIQIGLYLLRAEPHLTAVDGNAIIHQDKSTAIDQHTANEIRPASPKKNGAEIARKLPSQQSATLRKIPNLAELHQKKSEACTPKIGHSDEIVSSSSADNHISNLESAEQQCTSSADHDALMQAFLKGAGIPGINLNTGITPEFMEMIGKLLSISVQGTFQLLATRASIKREVKADLTMVVVRNNNPLKFLSDSETVLTQMLRKKMPGFMGPAEAMQDAFEDLQAHQTGMIAGMNGAISEVLKRFDPKALDKRVNPPSLFDSMLPLKRKAQMWDQYDRMFEEINREAQHDYQKLFGKAFLKAYEKEIERSRNEEQDG